MSKFLSVIRVILLVLVVTTYLHLKYKTEPYDEDFIKRREIFKNIQKHLNGNWRNLTQHEKNGLSNLGRMLFLDESPPIPTFRTTPYIILIWKHGQSLKKRHIYHFTEKQFDPFESCSVANCQITYEDRDISSADLILFHLHKTKSVRELPHQKRSPTQIWTFLTDESPYNTFLYRKNNRITSYNGIFNWSMSYRMISDIPVPYGRTILKNSTINWDFETWNKSKVQTVLVAVLASNCGVGNARWDYVRELRKHIQVDFYGDCGSFKCAGHYDLDCTNTSKYKFYLSFENSNCDEYITEKAFWNGYRKKSIPIVMGGSKESYGKILPPNSYIHVEDFSTPRDLADYIKYLNSSSKELQSYFKWKEYFSVLNEHGYFQSMSVHYCRICEALHYNSKERKTYTKLEEFLSKEQCHARWLTASSGKG